MKLFNQIKHKIVSRRWTSRSERLRGAPFGSLALAFILIDGAGSDEIVRFPFNPKTAVRSLGEWVAHLRLRGNLYLAKRLQKFILFP
ncbi:MAG: hypothetical protein QME83_04325 [Thermodesulfobacteriota bacterium]|nr:hypothetical protein [Thermodesulfobacteriota bacterium]